MKWCEDYSVGVNEIDEQHKKLYELISDCSEVSFDKSPEELHDEIVRVLVKLNLYTIFHFETEERLLEANGYEELESHKREHAKFVEKLEGLHPDKEEIKSEETLGEIVKFLEVWIENHILKSDFKYKELMADRMADGSFVAFQKPEPFVFPKELENLE